VRPVVCEHLSPSLQFVPLLHDWEHMRQLACYLDAIKVGPIGSAVGL
jgi:hypothetical protein